jgi:hypothetical protein
MLILVHCADIDKNLLLSVGFIINIYIDIQLVYFRTFYEVNSLN